MKDDFDKLLGIAFFIYVLLYLLFSCSDHGGKYGADIDGGYSDYADYGDY